jgi:modulator of FtsH protease
MFPAPHESTFSSLGTQSLPAERVSFLRKVYILMTGAVATSAATAALASFAGASTPAIVRTSQGTLELPPLIYWGIAHPFIGIALLLGGTFGASMVARRPGLNVAALFGLSAVIGLVMAPAIYFAQIRAQAGNTISSQPVLHAFALAVTGFVGLSAYAIVTKRDFSALRGMLTMGLFVVIGASILNMFFGGAALSLAVASAAVLLFGGFVLYDTSRMLREGEDEPVVAALSLYLSFLNLFMALLRILGGSRRDG